MLLLISSNKQWTTWVGVAVVSRYPTNRYYFEKNGQEQQGDKHGGRLGPPWDHVKVIHNSNAHVQAIMFTTNCHKTS